jgi:two-component system response regulator HydG
MFLDAVGDIPCPQIKLLRVLENGEITRVGSNHRIKSTADGCRPPTETSRTPSRPARSAATLPSLKVVDPPCELCERSQDIPILIDYFMRQFARSRKQLRAGAAPDDGSWRSTGGQCAPNWGNVVESMVVVDATDCRAADSRGTGQPRRKPGEPSGRFAGRVGRRRDGKSRGCSSPRRCVSARQRVEAARMLGIGERTLFGR